MKNLKHDIRAIEQAIAEIRLKSRAQVLLVLRKSSGNYRDVDYLIGAVGTIGLLVFAVVSPYDFPLISLPVPAAIAFLLGVGISRRTEVFRKVLTTRKRKHEQVRKSAAALFTDKSLFETEARCGILLYYSTLERRAEIITDVAAAAALSKHIHHVHRQFENACNAYKRRRPSTPVLAEFLRSFSVLLYRELPRTPNEISSSIATEVPDLDSEDSI